MTGASIHPMGRPEEQQPREITTGMRVRSADYGNGTVVAFVGSGIQVRWDKPIDGKHAHYLVHDVIFVQRLDLAE
jgi:hypothetical protein